MGLVLPDVPRSRRTSSHDLTALVLPDVPRTWRTLSRGSCPQRFSSPAYLVPRLGRSCAPRRSSSPNREHVRVTPCRGQLGVPEHVCHFRPFWGHGLAPAPKTWCPCDVRGTPGIKDPATARDEVRRGRETSGRTGHAKSPGEVRRGRGAPGRTRSAKSRDEVRRERGQKPLTFLEPGQRLGVYCSPEVPRSRRASSRLGGSTLLVPGVPHRDLADLVLPDVARSRRTSSRDLADLVLPDVPRSRRTVQ